MDITVTSAHKNLSLKSCKRSWGPGKTEDMKNYELDQLTHCGKSSDSPRVED